MADPAVQKQVAEMSAAMQNEKVQKRFEELRVRMQFFRFIFEVGFAKKRCQVLAADGENGGNRGVEGLRNGERMNRLN